jgi:hypothetical protein
MINIVIMTTNTRGPKPGTTAGRKRKPAEELSKNPHTKKARDRMANMNPIEAEIERAKNADRQAVTRALKALRTTSAYKNASREEKTGMEEKHKHDILQGR